MQLKVDDTMTMIEKGPPMDTITDELDETTFDDNKPPTAIEREENDIIKVKKVCKVFR